MAKKRRKKKYRIKNNILNMILLISTFLCLFSLGKIGLDTLSIHQLKQKETQLRKLVYDQPNTELSFNSDKFVELQQLNPDFSAWLTFDHSFIDLPVVQSTDNYTYLKQSFTKEKSSRGTVFMDYRNTWNDQNITLYGHYVYNDSSSMFTPLQQLHDKDNFLAHQTLKLYTSQSVRQYKLIFLYLFDEEVEPTFDYTISQFSTPADFKQFIQDIESKDLMKLNEEISETDKLLTLQTCVRNKDHQRLIVVAKLVDEQPYNITNP